MIDPILYPRDWQNFKTENIGYWQRRGTAHPAGGSLNSFFPCKNVDFSSEVEAMNMHFHYSVCTLEGILESPREP